MLRWRKDVLYVWCWIYSLLARWGTRWVVRCNKRVIWTLNAGMDEWGVYRTMVGGGGGWNSSLGPSKQTCTVSHLAQQNLCHLGAGWYLGSRLLGNPRCWTCLSIYDEFRNQFLVFAFYGRHSVRSQLVLVTLACNVYTPTAPYLHRMWANCTIPDYIGHPINHERVWKRSYWRVVETENNFCQYLML